MGRLVSIILPFLMLGCAARQTPDLDEHNTEVQEGPLRVDGETISAINIHEENGCHPATFEDEQPQIRARFHAILEGRCDRDGYEIISEQYQCRPNFLMNHSYQANLVGICHD